MRIFITLILFIAIAGTYFSVNRLLDSKVVVKKEYMVNFSEKNTGIEKLDSMGNYDPIIRRPLFIESRELIKKVVKKKKKRVKPVVQDLKVQALGIALTGEGILAVIKDLKNGKIIRLRIKEEIYGWSLEGVSEDNFIFSKNEQRKIINFKK